MNRGAENPFQAFRERAVQTQPHAWQDEHPSLYTVISDININSSFDRANFIAEMTTHVSSLPIKSQVMNGVEKVNKWKL